MDSWVGKELLHQVTKNGRYKLKVDVRHRAIETAWQWAEYDTIVVSNDASQYLMHRGLQWPDGLLPHSGGRFTTYDRDNDDDPNQNCAVTRAGSFWWNSDCHKRHSGLNTPLGSSGDFRWYHSTQPNSTQLNSRLLTNGSRMAKRNTAHKNKSNDQSE